MRAPQVILALLLSSALFSFATHQASADSRTDQSVNVSFIGPSAATNGDAFPTVASPAIERKTYLPFVCDLPVTSVRIAPLADATVFSGLRSLNLGKTKDMGAGYDKCLSVPGIYRALLKFDVSAIPVNSQISSARLFLYLTNSCDEPDQTRPLTAYRLFGWWTETGVTWANQPLIMEAHRTITMPSKAWGWYPIDVTDLVRGWVDGTMPNDGLMLQSTEAISSDSATLFFGAREGDVTYTSHLDITYVRGTAQ